MLLKLNIFRNLVLYNSSKGIWLQILCINRCMTILTKVYLYRRDKWENVRRENKKWEGQNTTIYYEQSADTRANTGLTFGKTS